MLNQIIHGDCLEEMKHISDKSIDMILCDLPYGTTACKWDVIIPFDKLWEQYERIIKPNGAIVLTASQPFTTILIQSKFELFKYSMVWVKDRPNGIGNANKMPMRYHEDICVFYKKLPTYTKQYTQRSEGGLNRVKYKVQSGFKDTDTNNHKFGLKEISVKYDDAKILGSVIDVKKDSPSILIHPTQKPVALFEYLIKTYTNESDLVLDNCCGSGTTAVAAINTNRNYICIEKEKEYFDIACDRINQPREYSELELEIKELNKPEFKQLSLFDIA
jgi:site-specific DNA-methyltransferase (adenine-specific)